VQPAGHRWIAIHGDLVQFLSALHLRQTIGTLHRGTLRRTTTQDKAEFFKLFFC